MIVEEATAGYNTFYQWYGIDARLIQFYCDFCKWNRLIRRNTKCYDNLRRERLRDNITFRSESNLYSFSIRKDKTLLIVFYLLCQSEELLKEKKKYKDFLWLKSIKVRLATIWKKAPKT